MPELKVNDTHDFAFFGFYINDAIALTIHSVLIPI